MDAAVYSLIGSLVGGTITATVTGTIAYFNLRRDRQKQEEQFSQQRQAQELHFAEERAKQARSFAEEWTKREAMMRQERATLRNAIEAEFNRVEVVVKRQWKYIWDPEEKKPRLGFDKNPLNWAPIHTPIWDSVVAQGKVGLLPEDDARNWSWFFGYVRWLNLDLLPLNKFYSDNGRLAEFARHVASAFESLIEGRWRPQRGAESQELSKATE